MDHETLGREIADYLQLKSKEGRFDTLFGKKSYKGLGQLVDGIYRQVYSKKLYSNLKETKLNRHLTKLKNITQ